MPNLLATGSGRADAVFDSLTQLFAAAERLERLYPGRRFTLDGHLIGSIGEVLASELYDLDLLPSSSECHDAVCPAGRQVQIKLTQTARVSIYSEPDFLIVLRLAPNRLIEEIYCGPGKPAWDAAGRRQKNGQRSLSLFRLRKLMLETAMPDRIVVRNTFDWFRHEAPRNLA